MSKHKTIAVVMGTRPEAIKLSKLIEGIKLDDSLDCKIVATAQHRELLDDVLSVFNISPDIDLSLMSPNQNLASLTSKCLVGLSNCFNEIEPDAVIAQGDTTTVMAASLASFYQGIPFGHVEAGLRSGDRQNPFPEEINRIIAGSMAQWHFAPTSKAKANLVSEQIDSSKIYITGNTVIDALMDVVSREENDTNFLIDDSKKIILLTAHRRENFGKPLEEIFEAVKEILNMRSDIQVLYPVHPNPNVKKIAYDFLGGLDDVILCDPLNYIQFIMAMKKSYLILSDSGGVQEEAPSLKKPVLVLRERTERMEAIEAGAAKLVGTDKESIVRNVNLLLDDRDYYKSFCLEVSPFGDGTASRQIVSILKESLISRS